MLNPGTDKRQAWKTEEGSLLDEARFWRRDRPGHIPARSSAIILAFALASLFAVYVSRGQQPVRTRQGEPAQLVGVVLREFGFEPRQLSLKAGLVRFQLINRGSMEHDFTIPALQGHAEHEKHLLKPGEGRTEEVVLQPGSYEVICTVPGHKDAGMVATIQVML